MISNVNCGLLKRRGEIQKPVFTEDEFTNDGVTTWEKVAGMFCEYEPLQGRELEIAKSFAPTVTSRITFRFQPNLKVDSTMRFVIAEINVTANINYVINDQGQSKKMILYCTELL
jgi:SPP1 family predicted phage head-tail adaptor